MSAVLKVEGVLDMDYLRNQYEGALSWARFTKKRLAQALADGVPGLRPVPGYPGACSGMDALRIHAAMELIDDYHLANARLERLYLSLCDAMEWDDDDAKAAGVTVRGLRLSRPDDDLARED